MERYRERLTVPPTWWLLMVGFALSLWMVYHHAYGPTVSIPVGVGSLVVGTVLLLTYGRLSVVVTDDTLAVGPARLPLSATGTVEAIRGTAARSARGPDLNPAAYTTIRGYVADIVRVGVDDVGDPTPCWIVSTRHPERLVAVIEAARTRRE